MYEGMSYVYLDPSGAPRCWGDGEVQVFCDYRQRAATARISRHEVLAGLTAVPAPADLNPLVWRRNGQKRRTRSEGRQADG
ncbi:hypothetical protein FHR32_004437 [Streptosporangium album]|uniref:Uncharacterized protein n=1 Tax=Streptosporangium album TaxID=47479 RepID=A0A7W7RY93_9ACTN|nr:hypothetical protein [Streptosporangium album]MBB4940132.1 hypothetical protein [Streptosporangium album]